MTEDERIADMFAALDDEPWPPDILERQRTYQQHDDDDDEHIPSLPCALRGCRDCQSHYE